MDNAENYDDVFGKGPEAVEVGAAAILEMAEACGIDIHQIVSPVELEDVPDLFGEGGEEEAMVTGGKDAFPGEKTEEDEKQPEHEKDIVDRLKKRRDQLQYAEYAMNAGEYAGAMKEVTDVVGKGAEGVKVIAAAVQEVDINTLTAGEGAAGAANNADYVLDIADKAGEWQDVADAVGEGGEALRAVAGLTQGGNVVFGIDIEQVGNVANDVANLADTVAGAASGANARRQLAADVIVDRHKYHECIDNTCLEEPVRCVTENCAVPLYEFIATNICEPFCTWFCKWFCSAGAEKVAENTEEVAEGAKAALGCVENCSETVCGIFDASQFCCLDEALSFALPFCGLIFSCFRLFQGTTLSCRGGIGTCKAVGKANTASRWMLLEGNARLWQGCCGLLGAAPGLIIITLPSILALSLVAGKARKTRLEIESDIAGKGDDHDPESNTETHDGKTHSFPDAEERKRYYHEAYEVAEGARLFKGIFYVTIVVYIINSFLALGPVLWIIFVTYLVAVSRARIAEEYNIPLNPVGNFWLAFCCTCCAATQVARHLFGWGQGSPCAGGCEIGPKPMSRWPAIPQKAPSMHQIGPIGYTSNSHRVVTDAQVIDAPSTVPPMTR